MNIFELNNINVEVEYLNNSAIYTIDNFYKHPESVYEYIFEKPYMEGRDCLWKLNEKPSYNGIHFEDRRFISFDEQVIDNYIFLSELINDMPFKPEIYTNVTSFRDVDESKDFNNFQDNYWWPHRDYGYTGIVYFTEEGGTNLYSDETTDDKNYITINEHHAPWRSKSDYELLKTLEPKYNRFVLFDGLKFLHGMDISTNRYFNGERRKNQVYFFYARVDDSTVYCV